MQRVNIYKSIVGKLMHPPNVNDDFAKCRTKPVLLIASPMQAGSTKIITTGVYLDIPTEGF